MSNLPTTSSSIYLLPGMKIRISWHYKEAFAKKGKQNIVNFDGELEERDLLRGFALVDQTTGTLEVTDKEEAAVYYTHKRFGNNRIYFYGSQDQKGILDVLSVPIHDHSSIAAGGPAYGTYFTDSDTI